MFIFDFDGVLINSVKEAGLSAYNSMTKNFVTCLDEIPEDCFNLYLKNIRHFHNPFTLCVLMSWCLENYERNPQGELSREEFRLFSQDVKFSPQEISPYFYSIREKFIDQNKEVWANLNEPFNPLWQALVESGGEKIVILTAKNKKAVLELCAHYGLKVLDENVYAGDGGVSKMDNFKVIHQKYSLKEYCFIDDHLKNLIDMSMAFSKDPEFNLHLFLCNWGYGDQADYDQAESLGFSVIDQTELISKLN